MNRIAAISLSGTLAVIGGALILASGVRVQSFMLEAVQFVYQKGGSSIPKSIVPFVNGFILALSVIIILGGSLAILGGFLIFSRHFTIGKILVALGGGFGFAGIAFSLGYDVYAYGFSVLILRAEYWAGVVIASIGRYVAKYTS